VVAKALQLGDRLLQRGAAALTLLDRRARAFDVAAASFSSVWRCAFSRRWLA